MYRGSEHRYRGHDSENQDNIGTHAIMIWGFIFALMLCPLNVYATSCDLARVLTAERPLADGEPVTVQAGVVLIDLFGIDQSRETFNADFMLFLQWKDPRLSEQALGRSIQHCKYQLDDIWHPNHQFLNQRNLSRQTIYDMHIGPDGTVLFSERVFGEFSSPLDMVDFPFDHQLLVVQLLAAGNSPDEVVFEIDEAKSGRLKGLSLAGWNLEANYTDTRLPPLEGAVSTHTRLNHAIQVNRNVGYYVWKHIVPLCFIMLMAYSVFWLDKDNVPPLAGIASASIFALIAFLLGMNHGLPPIAYLTRMDQFVFGIMVLVFLALAELIVASRLWHDGNPEAARRIDFHARWIYLVAFSVLVYITMFMGVD